MSVENNGLYSPDQVQLIVRGRTMQGFGDGTFIEWKYNKPEKFSTKTGAKGEGTFVENLDRSGVFTVHIKQNAAAEHQFLRSLLNSKAVFTTQLLRVIPGYSEAGNATNCMIKTEPQKSYAQDEETYIWEIGALSGQFNDTPG
jgi:hypothetical protein